MKSYTKTHKRATISSMRSASAATLTAAAHQRMSPREMGRRGSCRLLIAAGADVNTADCDGNAPLQLALAKGHVEVAGRLVEGGASVNLQNDY
jgi:ankyrin repeat protein